MGENEQQEQAIATLRELLGEYADYFTDARNKLIHVTLDNGSFTNTNQIPLAIQDLGNIDLNKISEMQSALGTLNSKLNK